jgi:glycosyltransferase involved in cell wall biosynthesis
LNALASPLVSVVTPVYNGERHLAECIESVPAQTYQNWEYIIVNNCSTDRTREIAESYARRDKRIRVHNNQQLVKMGPNHDIALSLISPESQYCKVLHADDFMFPECLERMVNVAVANPSVGIVGAYRLDNKEVNLDGLPYPSTVVAGREICRQFLLNGLFVFGSPSSVLIRSDLIRSRKQFMDDDTFFMHGDTAACHEMLMKTDFGFVHQVLTFTRRHESATDTPRAVMLNSYLPGNMMMLKTYGPFYLEADEIEQCIAHRLRGYYNFLGKNLVAYRDMDFWNFHCHALNALGIRLRYGRLARASITAAKRAYLLHPLRTTESILKSIRQLAAISFKAGR